jgi:hypothetical protein
MCDHFAGRLMALTRKSFATGLFVHDAHDLIMGMQLYFLQRHHGLATKNIRAPDHAKTNDADFPSKFRRVSIQRLSWAAQHASRVATSSAQMGHIFRSVQ